MPFRRPLRLKIAALILAFASTLVAAEKKNVVLIAGRPSHGPGEHEHNAGVLLLAKCLRENAADLVDVKVHLNAEWPDEGELQRADTILIYSDGAGGHPALQDNHLQQLSKQMARGCGFVCLHFAVEVPVKPGGEEFKNWLGGYFEPFWSVNPHWDAKYQEFPKHPVCQGVKPFGSRDEWYFHMRFQDGMKGVTPILSDLPPPQTVSNTDSDRGGNPAVRLALQNKEPQHTAWATERADGGRGFGFTGGHFHKGWANDQQRKLVLNAIVWTAKAQVPPDGINSKITDDDMLENQDDKGQNKARKPAAPAPAAAPRAASGVGYGLEDAQTNMTTFTTPPGLAASLFAAEPMIQNPTNIDIDHRGRVWATECVNYRGYLTLREEGDRVVILEDTDGDGIADKEKTFFQSPDLTNPLGICVLPQAKGTKVIVSAAPDVWLLTDNDGDDVAEKAEVIFKVGGVWNYDHQIHAFVLGPDGKYYFNAGNSVTELKWPDGSIVKDIAGNEVTNQGKPYRQGMVFRCDIDLTTAKASHVEVLGHNFRNNYEVCVDSFGTLWQSDNDDDGSQAVRINYVMEYGNFGYTDELTGAGWQTKRSNLEEEIPRRHWHLNDPGVVPNLLHTGAGAPTGILVNEGTLLGDPFTNQLIHCDAGPRTTRAYPVTKDGAGYKATMTDILTSTDTWYRASDAAIAPDGSLVVADWYDPGVGGHAMGDHEKGKVRGRIYRVAPPGAKPTAPTIDLTTPTGAVTALQSPNRAARGMAWQALHAQGAAATSALAKLWQSPLPRMRARALGVLARIPGNEIKALTAGLNDADPDVRTWAVRLTSTLARSEVIDPAILTNNTLFTNRLLNDPSPAVRRQIAISLHGQKDMAKQWATLALQHDGKDRWYLEALGIGAAGNDDACFDAWLAAAGTQWNTPAGRDILWRLRSSKTAAYLAKIAGDKSLTENGMSRYMRAFDFLPASPAKQAALVAIAGSGATAGITREALVRLRGPSTPELAGVVRGALDNAAGTPQFVELARDFGAAGLGTALLDTAVAIANDPAANDAITMLYQDADADKIIDAALAGERATGVIAVLGSTATARGLDRLSALISNNQAATGLRQQAVRALARTQAGATVLVKQAKNQQLPAELAPVAASALRLVQYAALQSDIDALFPAPAALGGKQLPSLTELANLHGDATQGRGIFERAESSCVLCHRVGGHGVDVAPALDTIGAKLSKTQLYDAIINPNAGLSMGFETTQLALKDGGAGLGIVRSETNNELVLALPGGVTQTFRKDDITKREKLSTSLMPNGLSQVLTQADLVDLVEYLASLKAK